jgi:hypothetical protein
VTVGVSDQVDRKLLLPAGTADFFLAVEKDLPDARKGAEAALADARTRMACVLADNDAAAVQVRARATAVDSALDQTIFPALTALDEHLATHERALRDKVSDEEAMKTTLAHELAETEVRTDAISLARICS